MITLEASEDAVNRAMSMTILHVGVAPMNQEGLLLPDVHNFNLIYDDSFADINSTSVLDGF